MLNIQTSGTGNRHILFVHGNSMSLGIWNNIVQSPLLSAYILTAIDLPGHGKSFRSIQPESDYSLKGFGRHLKDFLSDYQSEEFIFVALSLGSNIISEIDPFPVSCRGVFLVGPTIAGDGLTVADIIKPNPHAAAFFMPQADESLVDALYGNIFVNSSQDLRDKYKRMYYETDPAFRECLGVALGRNEWTEEIRRLREAAIPVAVVYGADETLVHQNYLDNLLPKKWHSKVILIPDAGHCIEADQPDRLAALINEFASDSFG